MLDNIFKFFGFQSVTFLTGSLPLGDNEPRKPNDFYMQIRLRRDSSKGVVAFLSFLYSLHCYVYISGTLSRRTFTRASTSTIFS